MKSVKVSVNDLAVADLELGPETEDDAPRAVLRRMHQSLGRIVEEFRQAVGTAVEGAERGMAGIRASGNAIVWQLISGVGGGRRFRLSGRGQARP